jgi:hypothetical protein
LRLVIVFGSYLLRHTIARQREPEAFASRMEGGGRESLVQDILKFIRELFCPSLSNRAQNSNLNKTTGCIK